MINFTLRGLLGFRVMGTVVTTYGFCTLHMFNALSNLQRNTQRSASLSFKSTYLPKRFLQLSGA